MRPPAWWPGRIEASSGPLTGEVAARRSAIPARHRRIPSRGQGRGPPVDNWPVLHWVAPQSITCLNGLIAEAPPPDRKTIMADHGRTPPRPTGPGPRPPGSPHRETRSPVARPLARSAAADGGTRIEKLEAQSRDPGPRPPGSPRRRAGAPGPPTAFADRPALAATGGSRLLPPNRQRTPRNPRGSM